MRIIEALGLQKKIITTCKHVKLYNFYRSNNHLVIDNIDVKAIKEFVKVDYDKSQEKFISKYTLEEFINTLIGLKMDKYLK